MRVHPRAGSAPISCLLPAHSRHMHTWELVCVLSSVESVMEELTLRHTDKPPGAPHLAGLEHLSHHSQHVPTTQSGRPSGKFHGHCRAALHV